MKTVVIYHANCLDGYGAAFAAYLHFGEEAEYIPAQYGDSSPSLKGGERVYILDFSYPRDVILEMGSIADEITVIDHHKTAEKHLSVSPAKFDMWTAEKHLSVPFDKMPNVRVKFDIWKSGAVLAWEHFHPDKKIPKLLELIQDRDLWGFKFPETKPMMRALWLYPNWRYWNIFLSEEKLKELLVEGRSILRFLELEIEKVIETPPRPFDLDNDTVVPIYNLPGFMISDALNMALAKYDETPYAVAYFDLPDKRVYSLRSRKKEDIDVSEIAERWGGGGHTHAAGFSREFGL